MVLALEVCVQIHNFLCIVCLEIPNCEHDKYKELIYSTFGFLLQEAISGLEDEVALGTGDRDLDLM